MRPAGPSTLPDKAGTQWSRRPTRSVTTSKPSPARLRHTSILPPIEIYSITSFWWRRHKCSASYGSACRTRLLRKLPASFPRISPIYRFISSPTIWGRSWLFRRRITGARPSNPCPAGTQLPRPTGSARPCRRSGSAPEQSVIPAEYLAPDRSACRRSPHRRRWR
ncbi:MAG: hypothetical protein ACI8S3_002054 [Alphaproteobacteria bacterium]|jgi:hypothetical protein